MSAHGTTVRDVEATRWETYLRHMTRCVEDLLHGYVTLGAMVARDGSAAGGGGGGRAGGAEVPAPVRLEVIDAMSGLEDAVATYVPLVRGTLRMGLRTQDRRTRAERTVDGLRFLGRSLRAVYGDDPDLGDRLTDALWTARADVGRYTGEGLRPFRVERPCAACGATSVWVRPEQLTTRCAACGDRSAASVASVVFSVSTPSP